VQIDVSLPLVDSIDGREHAALIERTGYDGVWVSEVAHDPFLALGVCATATSRLTLGTAVAIALSRSPMTVAVQAYDLQSLTRGRLRLGLGSQVRAHLTRRFSMPWARPVDRMREFAAALRAIWSSWEDGGPLRFERDFYTHTLMSSAFVPPPTGYCRPPILLSGVGPRMTEMAGEAADAFICHAFTTPRYVREVTIPALLRGRGTRSLDGYELVVVQMVATGATATQQAAGREAVRQQIAFYASTPTYARILELHDRAPIAAQLQMLARDHRWDEMSALVDDDLVDAVAVVTEPEDVVDAARRRYMGTADRVILYAPGGMSDDVLERTASGLAVR
jgi:probable F420-dependent oxidoreductase